MGSSPKQSSGSSGPERSAAPAVPEQRTASDAAPPTLEPARSPRRWSRARLALAVLGGVLALLCLGGAGIGYLLYSEVAEPDRSAPDVAVSSYLRALLVERNEAQTGLYQCANPAELGPIRKLRSDIEGQEKRLDTSIAVSWGSLSVSDEGESAAVVATTIRRTGVVDGTTQSLADDWRFRVVDEGGWRVCAATKLG